MGTQHRPAAPSWLVGGIVGGIAGGGVATGVVTTGLHVGGPVGWGILAGVSALATTLVVWDTVHLVQKRAHDEGYAAGFVARGNADDFFADAGIQRPTFLPAEHYSVHVDIEAPAPAVSETGAPRGGNIERPAPVSPDAGLHAFYALAQREAEMDAAFALCAEPQNAYLKTLDEEVDDLLRDRAGFSLPR